MPPIGRKLASLGPKQPPTPPTVARKCGHPELLSSIQSRDCSDCKAKRGGGRKPKGYNPVHPADNPKRGRLPHGARFEVEYDAEAQVWRGFLMLTLTPNRQAFAASASAVFYLLRQLDRQYRDWLAAQQPPTA